MLRCADDDDDDEEEDDMLQGLVNGSWGITFPNRVAPVPPSLQPKHPFLPKTIQLAFL